MKSLSGHLSQTAHFAISVVLLISSFVCRAQTGLLTGTIIDASTSLPLPFVNVYVNRTTLGTESDVDGNFELTGLPEGNLDIVCSFVGYETVRLELQFKEGEAKNIRIKLSRQDRELETVTITAEKDNQWRKNFSQFRKAFFGKDGFAGQCEILNSHVLEFTKIDGTWLKAEATMPLEIVNSALGYRMTYELTQFLYSPNQFSIKGNIRFQAMETDDPKLLQQWDKNRTTAYAKSLRYFFKSIVDNRLEENGFHVYLEKPLNVTLARTNLFSETRSNLTLFRPADHLEKRTNSRAYIVPFASRMEIHDNRQRTGSVYDDVQASVSWIEAKEPLVISESGALQNPSALQVIGFMSDVRIAQRLPEDFSPDEGKIHENYRTSMEPPQLVEKIYVHTDKDYYYPGEVIWFKGYMNCAGVISPDSVSGVAYVELINGSREILTRQALWIQAGTFHGQINLPAGLERGDYFFRAYTEYMRNSGEANFYFKPLPILSPFERVASSPPLNGEPQHLNVSIVPSKLHYQTREEIQLTISIQDEDSSYVSADLSVSVVDSLLFKQLPEERTLHNVFRSVQEPSTEIKHPLESGITVRGRFSADKTTSEPITILAVLGDFTQVKSVSVDQNGDFFLSGLHFYDSSRVGFQVLNRKGRPYGLYELSKPIPPEVTIFRKADINLVQSSSKIPGLLDTEAGAIQLGEVTISAKSKKSTHDIYAAGEFRLNREEIKAANYPDIISLMRARFRGVRTLHRMGTKGLPVETIVISGTASNLLKTDPLLVVDGVPYADQIDVAKTIREFSIQQVESIEVLKGSAAARYGSRGLNGVIVLNTRASSGKFESSPNDLQDSFTFFPLIGYSTTKPFTFKDHKVASSDDYPDNRTTLYWNPSVWTDATTLQQQTLTFTAGDLPSVYRITVKGVTSDGRPFSKNSYITVVD